MRFLVPSILVLAAGCNRLEEVEATASPIVAQGLFLGVDIPPGVDLSGSEELAQAAVCQVFLAEVSDPSQLAEAPMEGASMRVRSPNVDGTLALAEEGEGKYVADSTDGLVYEPGDRPVVTFDTPDGAEGRLEVLAPEAPEVELPAVIATFEEVHVDLTDHDYQNVIVAAYDVDRGNLTWDNLPDGVDQIYEYTHTEEPVRELTIPGDAFRRQGTYVVGVAGMKIGDATTFEGVNTTLSAFMAGQLDLSLVVVEQQE